MKKYIFVNDTRTQQNWGCHATSYCFEEHFNSLGYECSGRIYLRDLQGSRQTLTRAIDKLDLSSSDCVFVNGEGSIYDNQPKGLMMLESIKIIRSINDKIKIIVVNSTYDLNGQSMINKISEVKDLVSLFTAREEVSLSNMKKLGIKNVILQPDFLYDRRVNINETKPYIILGGNSNYYRPDRRPYDALRAYRGITAELMKLDREVILYSSDVSDVRYLSLISKEFGLKHITPNNANWMQAMEILSQATLSISGRYHPTIMSLCGNVPSYMVSANNCKMKGTHGLFYTNKDNFSDSHQFGEDKHKICNWVNKVLKNQAFEKEMVKNKLEECRAKLNKAKEEIYDTLR